MDAEPDCKVKNESKSIVESEVILPPVLQLPLLNREEMELNALVRYLEFINELCTEVPLDQLCEEDLTDAEKIKRKECTDGIVEWVQKCNKDSGEADLMVYPHSTAVTYHMGSLKTLLKAVYERKALKARQEAEEKRRLAALEEIKPPLDDAEKYLTKQEYQRFINSLDGAADAYLDGGRSCAFNDWRFDRRTDAYIGLSGIIEKRKNKSIRQKRAELEHSQFLVEINDTIKTFKQELAKEKRPKFTYPPALAKYEPNRWSELELPTEGEVKQWAEPYVMERVPQALRRFVSWNVNWQVQALPYAKYELVGLPCLTWCFKLLVLAEVHLKVVERKFARVFHGYEYQMEVEPEELCHFYLGPVQWEDQQEGFTTPLSLLSTLAIGKLEDKGIKVVEQDGSRICHCIQGYDEDSTEIDERFRQFIMDVAKDKSLAQGLLASGVIDEVTAKLMDEKSMVLLPPLVGIQASTKKITDSEVAAALEAMGYKKTEVKLAVEATQFSPEMSLEEKVKAVLKNVGI